MSAKIAADIFRKCIKVARTLGYFTASIHDHRSVFDAQILTYLKENLTGQALDSVSGLSLTANNYRAAMQLLHDRYGSQEILVNVLYIALMELPASSNKTA